VASGRSCNRTIFFTLQRQIAEGTALIMMRQTFGDEQVMEMARDMDSEQRLELLQRHSNQCQSMMESVIDD
jgi:hypothetical protein